VSSESDVPFGYLRPLREQKAREHKMREHKMREHKMREHKMREHKVRERKRVSGREWARRGRESE
jgi:hypothetical protein